MIPLLLFLAAAPTPTRVAVTAQPRTLADVARERRLSKEKTGGVFSAAESRGTGYTASSEYERPKRERTEPTPAPELSVEDGEAYWRGRVRSIRADIRAAAAKLSDMQASTPMTHFANPNSAAAALASQIRETALAPYRAAVREAEGRLLALEAECSAAKVQGHFCADAWLR